MKLKFWPIFGMVLVTFLSSSAQLLWKMGVSDMNLNFFSIIFNFYLIAGLSLYALGFVIMTICLKYGDVSVLYPIMASSFVWVSFLSFFFLGESFGALKGAGVGLIVIGTSALQVKSND